MSNRQTSDSVVLSGATAALDMGLSLFNWGVAHTVPKSVFAYTDRKVAHVAEVTSSTVAHVAEVTSTKVCFFFFPMFSCPPADAGTLKVAQLSAFTNKVVSLDAFDLVDSLLDSSYEDESSRVVPEQPVHIELARQQPVASLRGIVARPSVVPVRALVTAGKAAALSQRAARRLLGSALERARAFSLSGLLARAAKWLLRLHERVSAVPAVQSAASHLPASLSSVAAQADHRVVMLLTSQAEKKASAPRLGPASDKTPREETRDEERLRAREQDSFVFEPIQDGLDSE